MAGLINDSFLSALAAEVERGCGWLRGPQRGDRGGGVGGELLGAERLADEVRVGAGPGDDAIGGGQDEEAWAGDGVVGGALGRGGVGDPAEEGRDGKTDALGDRQEAAWLCGAWPEGRADGGLEVLADLDGRVGRWVGLTDFRR